MKAKDGLIIQKKFGLRSDKKIGEAASADQRQQISSQMPVRKSLRRKGYLAEPVLMHKKVPYSVKKLSQRILIRRGRK